MSLSGWLPILAGVLAAATPLLIAALGELIAEKSGVLNLGVEGMMLVGALTAFAVASGGAGYAAGALAGALAGVGLAALFAWLTLNCLASQVACGLAITMLGSGLSAYAGRDYVSRTLDGMALIPLDGGFGFDPLIVTGLLLTVLVWYFLQRSRAGLVLRAVGESPATAHALGLPVRRIRWAAVLFGGACAGLAGAYLAIDYTPMWVEGLSAGRGWIALALVVFAGWRPGRTLLGAWLYGGVGILQFHAQALGIAVPAQFLGMLPYLATIVVLTLIARDPLTQRRHTPASLGQPWHPHA